MADTIDAITDNAEQVLGQVDDTAAGLVDDPSPENPDVEGSDEDQDFDEDSYEDTPKEELVKRLQSQEKQYKEIRSLHDRQMNELRESQKQQFEVLRQLAESRGAQPPEAAPQVDDDSFVEEWAEKIAPDDPERGKATIEFMRGVMGDALTRIEQENQQLRTRLEGRLTQQDPDYVRHKAFVDELVKDGMPMDKAVSFAKRHAGGKPAAQPGDVQPPGRVAAGTRAAPSGASSSPIELDPATRNMMRMVAGSLPGNQDADKFIQRLARDVARDRQRAGE